MKTMEMEMSRARSFAKFRNLDRGRRRLVLRAAASVTAASAAIACLPFRRAIRFGSVPVSTRSEHRVDDWLWAVEAVARRLPWRTMCIEKGLALQRLLRRDGIDARLHYGARHVPPERKLEAHVWVTVAGRSVLGGEEAAGFAEIASYP
jgi:hypothetical protein